MASTSRDQYPGDPGQQAAGKAADISTSILDYITGAGGGGTPWWNPIKQAAAANPQAYAQSNQPAGGSVQATSKVALAPYVDASGQWTLGTGVPSSGTTPGSTPTNIPTGGTVQSAGGPTTSAGTGTLSSFNPLAMNAYMNSFLVPQIHAQTQMMMDANQKLRDTAMQNPAFKYMPANMQEMFMSDADRIAQQNNQMYTANMNSALSGAALDQMLNAITSARGASLQDYERILNQQAGSGAGLAPTDASSAQAMVDQATQAIQQANQAGQTAAASVKTGP